MIFPRQARDKHRENSKKGPFVAGGDIRKKGIELLHESQFAKVWPPATLDDPTAIDIVTPCSITNPAADRSSFLSFKSMAAHYDKTGSSRGVRVVNMDPHVLPRAYKHRLLASGMAMDDVEELDARLARTDTDQEGAACTTTEGSILINMHCRFEWATLRASEEQLKFVEELHAGVCMALNVRGTDGSWGHALPTEATEGSDIRILSVRRGPNEDIIRQSIAFVVEIVMFLLRLVFSFYISIRYNSCVCCKRLHHSRKLKSLRITHNEILAYLGKATEERDPVAFSEKLLTAPAAPAAEELLIDDEEEEEEDDGPADSAAEDGDDGKKKKKKKKRKKKAKKKKVELPVPLSPPINDWVQAFDPITNLVYFFNIVPNEAGDHETANFNPNNPCVRVCCRVTKKSVDVGIVAGKTVFGAGKTVYDGSKKVAEFGYETTKKGYHWIRPPREPAPPGADDAGGGGAARRGGGRREREWASGGGGGGRSEDTANPLFGFGRESGATDPIERLFTQIDRDSSGEISFDEFAEWYELNIGAVDAAQEIFDELDEDGTGLLDVVEFKMILTEMAEADWVAATDQQSGRPYYVNVKTRATRWVPPGDAEVNDWLASMLQSGGDSGVGSDFPTVSGELTADALFDAVDADSSGEVSFPELVAWWEDRQRALGKADDGSLGKIESIFADLDEDNSNSLNREEFKMILTDVVMGNWVAAQDAVSGRTYYVNKSTRETRWIPPGEPEVAAFLKEQLDDDGGGAAAAHEPGPEHVDRAVLSVNGQSACTVAARKEPLRARSIVR